MTGRDTVVVADDEESLVSLYEAFLSDSYDVRVATSGADALEHVDDDVDAVLLDRRMPGMNGDEVVSRLREQGYTVPIALVTAVDPGADIVDMPVDDYKVKPVTKDGLQSLVDVLVQRSKYDSRSREFFRLAAKKAALSDGGRAEEVMEIKERMNELHKR